VFDVRHSCLTLCLHGADLRHNCLTTAKLLQTRRSPCTRTPSRAQQTHTNPRPANPLVSGSGVATVGTFAAGQSEHGSIHVAADAETGSFASGLNETVPSITA
jgi:hypothetical protein